MLTNRIYTVKSIFRAPKLLMALMLLVGCAGEPEPKISVPAGAVLGDLTLEPCTYEVSWGTFDAECGTLIVPENRDDPDTRLIAIPVTRIFATGDSPGEPVFWLNGGPGITNMRLSSFNGFIENHDLILVGYRGIDGSTTLDCPEVVDAFANLDGDILSPEAQDQLAAAYAACADRLQNEGIDTDGYIVSEVVEDIEAARQALGYNRIQLYSASYGTRLALIYAWLYPDNVRRSAMAGVNPPGHFVWDPARIDSQFAYYGELCAQDPHCSGRTDDLVAPIRQALANMPKSWMFVPISRDNILFGTFMMMYHTGSAIKMLDAWLAAAGGDYSAMAMLFLMMDYILPTASAWGESASKALSTDYVIEPGYDYMTEMMGPGHVIGSPSSLLGFGGAAGWPRKLIPAELRQVQPSEVDMLFISGTVDFSTPWESTADELLPYMPNARQIVLREFGHTGDLDWLQPEARARLLTSYFLDGTIDTSLFTYNKLDFEVGLGFPEYAKIGLAVILLVLGAILFGSYWGWRKLGRRSTGAS